MAFQFSIHFGSHKSHKLKESFQKNVSIFSVLFFQVSLFYQENLGSLFMPSQGLEHISQLKKAICFQL